MRETSHLEGSLPDLSARLQAAQARALAQMEQALAASRAMLATHVAKAATAASGGFKVVSAMPPEFRVFKHTATGVCVVLRNVEHSPGFECVLGPKLADGSSLAFGAAMEFTRESLKQTVLKSIDGGPAGESSLEDLEELAGRIKAPGFFGQAAQPIT